MNKSELWKILDKNKNDIEDTVSTKNELWRKLESNEPYIPKLPKLPKLVEIEPLIVNKLDDIVGPIMLIKADVYHKDKIRCITCGKMYARGGVTSHKGTQYHLLHEKFNPK